MPYVPSEKTDGKSQDRNLIDAKVEDLANDIAVRADTNFSILHLYQAAFSNIGYYLAEAQRGTMSTLRSDPALVLASTIFDVGKGYGYEGAFLGELNYAITRLIQRVPQIKVSEGQWQAKDELRYWLYAVTVEALAWASDEFRAQGVGISGVFEDIKDEYKRRVNVGYEAAQIIKSGDCYDTPYYTRLVEVIDENGNHIGYQEVMLKRSEETLKLDVLKLQHVLVAPKNADILN